MVPGCMQATVSVIAAVTVVVLPLRLVSVACRVWEYLSSFNTSCAG